MNRSFAMKLKTQPKWSKNPSSQTEYHDWLSSKSLSSTVSRSESSSKGKVRMWPTGMSPLNESTLKHGNKLLMQNTVMINKETRATNCAIKRNNKLIYTLKQEKQRLDKQIQYDINKMAGLRCELARQQTTIQNLERTIVKYGQSIILQQEAAYLAQNNIQPKPVQERSGDIMPIPAVEMVASTT